MSVAPVSSDEDPARVDGQVDGGGDLLVELDHLDDLDLPALLDVKQVDAVVATHGQELALVHNPDQFLHFTMDTQIYWCN